MKKVKQHTPLILAFFQLDNNGNKTWFNQGGFYYTKKYIDNKLVYYEDNNGVTCDFSKTILQASHVSIKSNGNALYTNF